MSSPRTTDAPAVLPLRLRAPAATLATVLLVIWALTGTGYFWPMWPWFGIAFALGLVSAVRWSHGLPETTNRRFARHAAQCAVIGLALLTIWAMSGAGYFWPVWPLLGLSLTVALRFMARRPAIEALEERVDELARTRSGALNVQATELRRIERDLHDGAQARLVALSMQLGRAEERLQDEGARDLVRRAREEATAAIRELRDLARGISPPVLADRGLEAAVQALADRSGVPVTVNAELPGRLPAATENAGYFVVAEALTNATKHGGGAPVRITLWAEHEELGIVVADAGPGGADPTGSGLTGLRQRVEALDGWLNVSGPAGEGTTIRAGLPCGS